MRDDLVGYAWEVRVGMLVDWSYPAITGTYIKRIVESGCAIKGYRVVRVDREQGAAYIRPVQNGKERDVLLFAEMEHLKEYVV